MLPSKKKPLSDYITARLELDFDAERRALAAVADTTTKEEADRWDWVRAGRQRRAATKALVKVLNERCGDGGESALLWLAATWGESTPLVDRRDRPYTSNGGGLTYLTECCLSTATYSDAVLCCRTCYQEVDPVLASTPDVTTTDTPYRGPTTPEQLAEAAGHRAYLEDQPAAPGADPVVMRLVEGMQVGNGGAAIFKAFQKGFTAEADAAAAAALAADSTAAVTSRPS